MLLELSFSEFGLVWFDLVHFTLVNSWFSFFVCLHFSVVWLDLVSG